MDDNEICKFIAEKLMGYTNIKIENVPGVLSLRGQSFPIMFGERNGKSESIPEYTKDMNAAIDAAQKMEELDFEWDLHYEGSRNDDYVGFEYVSCFGGGGDRKIDKIIQGIDKDPAKAIAIAIVNSFKHFKMDKK